MPGNIFVDAIGGGNNGGSGCSGLAHGLVKGRDWVLFGNEFVIYEVWEIGLWLIFTLVCCFCDWVSFFTVVNNILNTMQTNHTKLGCF